MSTIVTRAGKGSALTHNEVDANFVNLNNDKLEAATTTTLSNKTIALGSNTVSGTLAQFNTAMTDADFATGGGTATGTNTGDQTSIVGITGTTAQFNTALTDGDFATLAGTETLTNKTLTSPTITSPTITGAAFNGSLGATTPDTVAATTISASGVATFSAGSAAAPALTTTGDTNTGIFFPAADTIAFSEGGTEAMRIDSAGNVGIGTTATEVPLIVNGVNGVSIASFGVTGRRYGIRNDGSLNFVNYTTDPNTVTTGMTLNAAGNLGLGVTPSAWDATFKAIDTSSTASIFSASTNNNFGMNVYYNSGYKYKTTNNAAFFRVNAGSFNWSIAPSGTAGNAITFTDAMTLTATGALAFGTATAYGTSGQFLKSNGNAAPTWSTLTVSGTLLNIQYFTASGTYTKATNNPSFVVVELVGGGGGGGNSATAGGTSSFGAFLSATGGAAGLATSGGTGGAGSGGSLNVSGSDGLNRILAGIVLGTNSYANGGGGSSRFGGGSQSAAPANTGAGGCSGGGSGTKGGGGGGYSTEKISASSLAASETVTVGAGGTSGGGSGLVIVYEYA